jgi:hypothetical protein
MWYSVCHGNVEAIPKNVEAPALLACGSTRSNPWILWRYRITIKDGSSLQHDCKKLRDDTLRDPEDVLR